MNMNDGQMKLPPHSQIGLVVIDKNSNNASQG